MMILNLTQEEIIAMDFDTFKKYVYKSHCS